MKLRGFPYLILIVFFLGSCALEDSGLNSLPEYDFAFIELFDDQNAGWIGGFADYPDSLKDELNFNIEYKVVNNVFAGNDNNILSVSARNPHRDLFYFIAKKFTGLDPSANYILSFSYEILMENKDLPGEGTTSDLYVKAGATQQRPDAKLISVTGDILSNSFILTADKGENQVNGADQIYFIKKIEEPLYTNSNVIISDQTNGDQIKVTTDANGEFWVIFGIDSTTNAELSFSFNTMVVFFKKEK